MNLEINSYNKCLYSLPFVKHMYIFSNLKGFVNKRLPKLIMIFFLWKRDFQFQVEWMLKLHFTASIYRERPRGTQSGAIFLQTFAMPAMAAEEKSAWEDELIRWSNKIKVMSGDHSLGTGRRGRGVSQLQWRWRWQSTRPKKKRSNHPFLGF